MKKALFTGTFDPFTIGHESIVTRALTFIDELIIAVSINKNKKTWFSLDQRLKMIADYYRDNPRVQVMAYDELTVDLARQVGAHLIVRGIRTIQDFEYEKTMADINRRLGGLETLLLFTQPDLGSISSTMARELLKYGKDIHLFIPDGLKLPE